MQEVTPSETTLTLQANCDEHSTRTPSHLSFTASQKKQQQPYGTVTSEDMGSRVTVSFLCTVAVVRGHISKSQKGNQE